MCVLRRAGQQRSMTAHLDTHVAKMTSLQGSHNWSAFLDLTGPNININSLKISY